jgi:MoxR-like ATPase
MAIDFKTLRQVAPHVLSVRKPLLLRGRHGIGKSEVVYQIAEELGLPVVERRASQMTEGDLVGLPSLKDGVTTWNPPEFLAEACNNAVVLFLDEVDRAVTEVRQGLFELCDSRKIAGQTLHPDTLIVAAVNGGEHGAQYQVGEMDPAELDRYTVFDVEPTVEDWLDWGKDNVAGAIWDFINQNRSHLEHSGEFEPNKVYPSRRSWKRLNDCLAQAGLTEDVKESSGSLLFNLTSGFVGFEAAVSFNDFCAKYESQVTVEDILDHNKTSATAEFGINDHCALIEKIDASGALNEELTDERCQNLVNYFVTLPSEAAMKLWSALGSSMQENVVKFHRGTSEDGRKVSVRMVEMLTGNKGDARAL